MLYNLSVINNEFVHLKPCVCGTLRTQPWLGIWNPTIKDEETYVICLECGRTTPSIIRGVNYTTPMDIKRAERMWNDGILAQ